VDRKLADAAACGFDARLSGTTACLALVAGDQVATANVGDSRAIVVRAAPGDRLQAIQLTQDAKPELPGVRARAALSHARRAPRPWRATVVVCAAREHRPRRRTCIARVSQGCLAGRKGVDLKTPERVAGGMDAWQAADLASAAAAWRRRRAGPAAGTQGQARPRRRAQERARIEGMGGSVRRLRSGGGTPVGPFRVYGSGANANTPGLAMSRSLGDTFAHALGVSAVPTFATHALSPQDQFLVRPPPAALPG